MEANVSVSIFNETENSISFTNMTSNSTMASNNSSTLAGAIALLTGVNVILRPLLKLLMSIGFLGNSVAFIVLCRKSYRNSSTAVYLRALVVFDTGVLVGFFLLDIFVLDVISIKWLCFFFDYIIVVFVNLSNWTLLLITGERLIAIAYPMNASRFLKKRYAYISLACLSVVMLVLDANDLFFYEDADWTFCQFTFKTETSRRIIFGFRIIHVLKFLVIPFPFISISSILIVVHLRRQSRIMKVALRGAGHCAAQDVQDKTQQIHRDDAGAQDHIKNSNRPKAERVTAAFARNPGPKVDVLKKTAQNIRKERERGLTMTLLALNACFLFTRLPFEIHNISLGIPPPVSLSPEQVAVKYILLANSNLNHALNVFLYLATGSRFRTEFKGMIAELWVKIRRR